MNRREFIERSVLGAAAMSLGLRVDWPIGCFNRPWTKWGFDHALREIKAAGYTTVGLLSRSADEPFIAATVTPEYLDGLKKRIAASGLKGNMGALRSRHAVSLDESIKEVRAQIDNARTLGLDFVLSFGADNPAELPHYCDVMRDAAAYAGERKIKLVMKPHGGISGAASEILEVISRVGHRNFSIWYDAGNIIHYTGKDPVTELAPIAKHVTGFCAKDCGAPKGDVMIQFGDGKVDFPAVFRGLKDGGFNGPIMVEGVKVGATPEETGVNARRNREFLDNVLASL